MKRIAVAGFQHETNTFAPFTADLAAFEMADSWPSLLRGHEVITRTRGMNLPIAGAVAEAEATGQVEVVPIVWCSAEPSGPVTSQAFDAICGMILRALDACGNLDGLYLDLHGAMVTDTHDDGQAELLRRIRARLGWHIPVVSSLDLHANLSQAFVDLVDAVAVFRTYPHLDMAETGARAMRELLRVVKHGPQQMCLRPVPFLVPLHAQVTGADPCQRLYARLDALPRDDYEFVELALGFTAADVAHCGPAVVAHAATKTRARHLADAILSDMCDAQPEFTAALMEPKAAVSRAMNTNGPVILADVQDNPGAGGSSDTTGILHTLMDAHAHEAVLGVLYDPEVAQDAHRRGLDAVIHAKLGGKISPIGGPPIEADMRVLALSDGRIRYTGEMYDGCTAEIGPSCLLRIESPNSTIKVVVSSARTQCLDRSFFTHFGVTLNAHKIICVKSTVHFRADFEPMASEIINVASPGLFPCDLSQVSYRNTSRRPSCAVDMTS